MHNTKLAGLLLLAGAALAMAAGEPRQVAPAGCQPAAGNAHGQLLRLSQLVDPSGRLAKLVADFHPAQPAQSEPVKRSSDAEAGAEQQVAAGSEQTAAVVAAPEAGSAASAASTTSSTTSATSTTTSAPPAASSSASAATGAPGPSPSAGPATTTVAPAAKSTEASNVTVNVFLQLAPDAKTEELVSGRSPPAPTTAPCSPN